MHLQPDGYQPVPRPLILVAALLAVLGLLAMHTLMVPPASAAPSTEPDHAAQEHSHPDHLEAPHSHRSAQPDAEVSPDGRSSSNGQPCATCPGCGPDTASVCALTPAKNSSNQLLLSVSDLAPAPHELTGWPIAGSNPPRTTATPPSLTVLSISRT